MPYSPADVQYALETTRILHEPDRRIDTFGATMFNFLLLSEMMDRANEIRIRSGKIRAERPRIVRHDGDGDFSFEGFGEQAGAFGEWLKANSVNFTVLQYGFTFTKSDVQESIVHEPYEHLKARLVGDAVREGNPMNAIIAGVDDTWEISLLKFTVDMIQKSSNINMFDFKRRGLL